jgi:hypothetical protein
VGANVGEGQDVLINALVEHAPLVRALAASAYEAGARYVAVRYSDTHLKRELIIHGDDATLDAQFVVFDVRGKERPATGWPEGAFGVQGTVEPVEAGYYRPILCRVDGDWEIETLRIVHNLPMAFPGQ